MQLFFQLHGQQTPLWWTAGIAVLGGGLLSKNVSERAVQYLGGSLFLVFAAGSVYDIVTRGSAG